MKHYVSRAKISAVPCLAYLLSYVGSRSISTVSAFAVPPQAASHRKETRLFSQVSTDDDTIVTPRSPETIHNFGPASSRDETLFTSERPGGDASGKIPLLAFDKWADFMKGKGIEQVLVLIDDDELEYYEDPGLLKLYENAGFTVHRNPMGEKGASTRAMETIAECNEAGNKIVAHCTHGQGRAGRIVAAWLTSRYNLSPEDATREALDTASKHGVTRLGSPSKLKEWLENV